MNIVRYLVENGLDLNVKNKYGILPIYYASLGGQLEVIKYFVSLGVDIFEKDNWGWLCIHYASHHGKVDVVKYLVQNGVDIDYRSDDSKTPLMIAAYNSSVLGWKWCTNW